MAHPYNVYSLPLQKGFIYHGVVIELDLQRLPRIRSSTVQRRRSFFNVRERSLFPLNARYSVTFSPVAMSKISRRVINIV